MLRADVVGGERLVAGDGAGEEALPERRPRHEPDAELLADGKHLCLGIACPDRVLTLHGRDRLDGVRSADGVGAGLRQAEVADLARVDQGP